MKVLEPGRQQNGWATETNCTGNGNGGGGCGAKLLVEEGDLYKTHHYDYSGGHDTYITFRCSQCRVQTDINNVPFAIQAKVRDKEQRPRESEK